MTDPPPPLNAAQASHSFCCPFDFRRHIDKWFCLEVPTALVRDDDRTHRFDEVDVR
jgi:hypothetical protein